MFKNNSKILMLFGLLPFILWLSLVFKGEIKVATVIIGTLLFIISYGVSSLNKKWVILSMISLIVCCITFFIMGLNNNYFKFIECYISVGMAFYYGVLHFFNYRLNR